MSISPGQRTSPGGIDTIVVSDFLRLVQEPPKEIVVAFSVIGNQVLLARL